MDSENERRDLFAAIREEEAFLRSQLTATESDYREAVKALVTLAQGDTGGSRAAAQVLLCRYNGSSDIRVSE